MGNKYHLLCLDCDKRECLELYELVFFLEEHGGHRIKLESECPGGEECDVDP